jgi:hypothetical protein
VDVLQTESAAHLTKEDAAENAKVAALRHEALQASKPSEY